MITRVVFTLLGVWLFFSAFLVGNAPPQFLNTLIVGVLVTVFGLAWIYGVKQARYAGAAAGFWLFAATMVLPRLERAGWIHNVVMAALLVITALFPTAPERMRRGVHTAR